VVGLLRPQKAHHVLLRAAKTLVERWPDLQVLIIGDGPERANIERLIAELELERNVRITGLRRDVPDVLAALDIAVCCSDFEGSPLSVLEYMAAGLPVVATEVGGLADLIESGINGLLVPPGDPAALATALAQLLSDRATARAMGARGVERRMEEFDISVIVRRLEALYGELLAQKGRVVSGA
jgi:glycosyltransferase involved in cell wall biosynthesis